MNKKAKDFIYKSIIYLAASITVGILSIIIGFIFVKGIGKVNLSFLTSDFNSKTTFVNVEVGNNIGEETNNYIPKLGIILEKNYEKEYSISEINNLSPVKYAKDTKKNQFKLKEKDNKKKKEKKK